MAEIHNMKIMILINWYSVNLSVILRVIIVVFVVGFVLLLSAHELQGIL